jgi:hypothetical protein
MPTHAIGSGTVNMPVNMPIDERSILGRVAGPGRMGEFFREMYLVGLRIRHPEVARRIEEVRAKYYGNKAEIDRAAASSVLLALVLLVTALEWLGADQDLRRPRAQRVRVCRVCRVGRRVEA